MFEENETLVDQGAWAVEPHETLSQKLSGVEQG